MMHDDGDRRHRGRGAAPRGRHRRPGRDRHALPDAREDGRPRCSGTSTSSRTSRRKHGKTATFMPKPLFGDNGSGMHTHQSLWKGGKPLFAGNGYGGLSRDGALHYIGGLLKHAPAICALHQPDHEQLQAPGAGLRSAGEPGLLAAQPLGRRPHPDVLALARRPSASSSAPRTRPATRTWRSPR